MTLFLIILALCRVVAPASAATLLRGDIKESERLRRLGAMFSPKPGEAVALRATEVRDFHRLVAPDKLHGSISVHPPKGVCLRITRSTDEVDDVICKKIDLSFRFSDLDRAGRLTWQVKTGDGDFGTELQWSSPYRIGSVIPFGIDALKDPPHYVYLSTCKAARGPTGRRIMLGLLTGETWLIHLPEVDTLAVQPEDVGNLDVDYTGGGKKGIKEPTDSKIEEKKSADAKAETAEAGNKGKDASNMVTNASDAAENARDDRKIWAIQARNAYVMPSDRFQPNGSVARGSRSQCRYIFSGPPEDPLTGRLECHQVDGYQQVYLPLTCLHELEVKPVSDKSVSQ